MYRSTIDEIIHVEAWKFAEKDSNYLEICHIDDPAACQLRILYPGSPYESFLHLPGSTTAFQAQSIVAAMKCCFEAGKKERSREIRDILEIDQ